jgi:hypothetical protein
VRWPRRWWRRRYWPDKPSLPSVPTIPFNLPPPRPWHDPEEVAFVRRGWEISHREMDNPGSVSDQEYDEHAAEWERRMGWT